MKRTDVHELLEALVGQELELMRHQEPKGRALEFITDVIEGLKRSKSKGPKLRKQRGQISLRDVERGRYVDHAVGTREAGFEKHIRQSTVSRAELGEPRRAGSLPVPDSNP